MKKLIIFTNILAAPLLYSQNASAFVVIDVATETNTGEISTNTKSISGDTSNISTKTNKISQDLQKTLEAITGPRTQDTATQTAAAPSQDEYLANIDRALDALKDASDGIKSQYEKRVTKDNKSNKEPLVENVSRTTVDMSFFIKAALDAMKIRKLNYQTVSQKIGQTDDLKGSIDQNSQIQAQNGQLLNELAGINNNILASNQTDIRNRASNSYQSMMAMDYNDN